LIPEGNDAVPRALIDATRFYHERARWFCRLLVIMPDHLHAILAFPPDKAMSATIQEWKRFLTRTHGVRWQEGYFDHRLRDEREAEECWHYLRQNPVRAGLVADEVAWPWVWAPDDGITPA